MPNENTSAGTPKIKGKGLLKVFLSFATGVGKTYSMLDEAHRRQRRGQDVVIGSIDAHSRSDTVSQLEGFEVIPAARVNGEPVLDVEAIKARHPGVVLVDDMERRNPTGARNEARWQDIQELLDSGISVLTTLNVQHLESLNDRVADITGVRVRETVPDTVFHAAEEVEFVDATPRALINRLERGDILPESEIAHARETFFKEGTLSALREIAMREAAGRVDEDVTEYRKAKRIERPWATNDRVMICISPSRPSLRLVRRGWRMAQKQHAEAVAIYVEEKETTEEEERILRTDFELCERLGIKIERLHGKVLDEVIRYARENNITQLVLGHSQRSKLQELTKGSLINDLARELRNIDILIVAAEASGG